jgi:hypothetical protein
MKLLLPCVKSCRSRAEVAVFQSLIVSLETDFTDFAVRFSRTSNEMAPSAKKARTSAAPTATSTGSHSKIDATHAEHLARHLADLYKCGRFTDLQVRHRN